MIDAKAAATDKNGAIKGSKSKPLQSKAAKEKAAQGPDPERTPRKGRARQRPPRRKKLRVLALMHEDLVPPEDVASLSESEFDRIKTESDILSALRDLGHETRTLGVRDSVQPIRQAIEDWNPDIVFNLLDEFQGEAIYDQHVVAFLELLRVPYTGNNPRGLVLARDKALSKKSSMGISKASIVRDDEALETRVRFIHERIRTDAIVEEFIPGREIYVGVLGNDRLVALPPRELKVDGLEPGEDLIATESLKHNVRYQEKHGVRVVDARSLPKGLEKALDRVSKRIYRMLSLEGYARIDYRLADDGKLYFLEANPNPELANYEELAAAAHRIGLSYPELIQRILNLGLRR